MRLNFKNGFSLLEISISLAIIGTLLVSGFSMLNGSNTATLRKDTEKRMQIIEKALASFVAIYNRLPCPADITLTDLSANSGLEYCYSAGSSFIYTVPSLPSSPTNYLGNVNYIKFGTVPYATLNLPKEYVADAWENKLVYAMTLSLGGNSATSSYGTPATTYSFESTNMGLLTVTDSQSATRTNNAAYVLLSVGNNGLGAYPRAASTSNTTPTNSFELINYNGLCASSSNNCGKFSALEQTNTYDDIVHYKQKWQLIKEAGAVLSNSTCTLAKNLIETSDTLYQSINYSYICTYNPLDGRCPVFFNSFIYKIRELCLNQF